MVQRWKASCGLLLGVCLFGGCLGGQTGHPDSEHHETCTAITDDHQIDGVSARQLLKALVGQYNAALRWQSGEVNAADHAQVGDDDEISITVSEQSGASVFDCDGQLRVPVQVTVTTRDSGISDSGPASVTATAANLNAINFSFGDENLELLAVLDKAEGKVLYGTLVPFGDIGRTNWAQFSTEPVGAGGAGGSSGQ